MENIEWQVIIAVFIFGGSWVGLCMLRRHLNKIERRKVRKQILKAISKLADE